MTRGNHWVLPLIIRVEKVVCMETCLRRSLGIASSGFWSHEPLTVYPFGVINKDIGLITQSQEKCVKGLKLEDDENKDEK